jgi:hypothetical protein
MGPQATEKAVRHNGAPEPCKAGLFPPNPEAVLLADVGVANPRHCLTTGGQQPQPPPRLMPSLRTRADCSTEAVRAGCLGTVSRRGLMVE